MKRIFMVCAWLLLLPCLSVAAKTPSDETFRLVYDHLTLQLPSQQTLVFNHGHILVVEYHKGAQIQLSTVSTNELPPPLKGAVSPADYVRYVMGDDASLNKKQALSQTQVTALNMLRQYNQSLGVVKKAVRGNITVYSTYPGSSDHFSAEVHIVEKPDSKHFIFIGFKGMAADAVNTVIQSINYH